MVSHTVDIPKVVDTQTMDKFMSDIRTPGILIPDINRRIRQRIPLHMPQRSKGYSRQRIRGHTK